ncbi:DUF5753 domain-containing protein [Nocardiopsis metallicus]|uniref:DUF5753 domain-containing protein n=1 Tax=Nocardiopsis metallicus TaxID=179819 RepID=A0A840WP27_9ACTN|nr:DUF5753 domain-containing protein [Nocardiopsis metallicus]MBB5494761.1 hypothetical protein [Nocardiopsis metallicus]
MSSAATPELPQQLLDSQTCLSADERQASIDAFSPAIVPGPLQTPAYARAVLSACGVTNPATLEEAVQLRMGRGHHVRTDHGHPHRYLLTEQALHTPWLGAQEVGEQRAFLRECVQLLHLRVRVLPTFSPIPWTGAFAILTYAEGEASVNVETPAGRLVAPQEMVPAYRAHFEALFAAAQPLSRVLAAHEGAGPQ